MSGARGPLDLRTKFARARTYAKGVSLSDVEMAVSQKNIASEKKNTKTKGGTICHPSQALQMHAETTSARHIPAALAV